MKSFLVIPVVTAVVIVGMTTGIMAQSYPYQPTPGGQLSSLPPEGRDLPNPLQAPAGTNLSPSRPGGMPGEAATRPLFPAYMTYDPYVSGLGPCAEGGQGSGCDRPAGRVIQPSKY